jgi:hypothetical protein
MGVELLGLGAYIQEAAVNRGPIAQPCPVPASKPLQQVYTETCAKMERVSAVGKIYTAPRTAHLCVGCEVANLCPGLAAELLAQLKVAWSGCMFGEDRDQATGEKFVRRIAKACGIEGA